MISYWSTTLLLNQAIISLLSNLCSKVYLLLYLVSKESSKLQEHFSCSEFYSIFPPFVFSSFFFFLFLLYFFSLFSFFYFLFPLLFSFFPIILGNGFSVYNKYKAMFLLVILHFTHLQLAVLQFCLKVTSG